MRPPRARSFDQKVRFFFIQNKDIAMRTLCKIIFPPVGFHTVLEYDHLHVHTLYSCSSNLLSKFVQVYLPGSIGNWLRKLLVKFLGKMQYKLAGSDAGVARGRGESTQFRNLVMCVYLGTHTTAVLHVLECTQLYCSSTATVCRTQL
jgi:hypothetical protein